MTMQASTDHIPGSDSVPQTGGFLEFSRGRTWIIAIIGWTILALVQGVRHYLVFNAFGRETLTWPSAFAWGMAEWYVWGILAPLVIWVTANIGIDRKRWFRCLALHLVAVLSISMLHIAIYTAVFKMVINVFELQMLLSLDTYLKMLGFMVRCRTHGTILIYVLIALISYAIIYYKRYHVHAQRLAQVRTQLAQARLEALKIQLHPHFLFDTLNAIMELIPTKPEAADLMTARLSELLRTALENEGVQEVRLQNELGFLDRYLEIQQIRFGDRLRVEKNISPETLDAYVPNLILQPLVENAIRHGIARRSDRGYLGIRAGREGELLEITISDDGPGAPESGPLDESIERSLDSTRQRLQQLYGGQSKIQIQREAPSRLTVRITFPFRVEESPSDETGEAEK